MDGEDVTNCRDVSPCKRSCLGTRKPTFADDGDQKNNNRAGNGLNRRCSAAEPERPPDEEFTAAPAHFRCGWR
jgi:hypothetical protein